MRHGKRSATPTLFPSPSGHPTDVPFLGDLLRDVPFSTYPPPKVSLSAVGIPGWGQSRYLARGGTLLNRPIFFKHYLPGGVTIGYVRLGSPICSGIIIHCTFSSNRFSYSFWTTRHSYGNRNMCQN